MTGALVDFSKLIAGANMCTIATNPLVLLLLVRFIRVNGYANNRFNTSGGEVLFPVIWADL
jgi:hypothetical protein